MKHTTKLITVLALLALLLIPAAPARALGPFDGGPVIFGGNYTLASGDTLNGDLVVFGGNVTIEADAQVKGSIVIFGGLITLDGAMTGDLVLVGASGSMGEKAVIQGDLVTVGGSLSRADGARIEGQIRNDPTIEIPAPTIPDVPTVPETPVVPQPGNPFNPIGSAFGVLGQAVLIAALAMLLVLFLRPQMERVAQTLVSTPLMAGGVGLLTIPAVIIAGLILILTLIGPFVLGLLFLAAWLFGIITIGMEVGERFTRAIDQNWTPVWTTGFGTFLVVLITQGVGIVPCVGWLVPFLLGVTGIGAIVLTFLNSRAKPPIVAAPAAGPDEALPPPA